MSCALCDGGCDGADLQPLLVPELAWLWRQLADRADRRGDARLTDGTVRVRIPASVEERVAAVGLLGGVPLRADQTRNVGLDVLTDRLEVRGARLTPGVVAAHAVGRRLATRAEVRTAQLAASEALRRQLDRQLATLPPHVTECVDPPGAWERLRSAGWVSRLLHTAAPARTLAAAIEVLGRLPRDDERVDRRRLVPGDPHALDDGRALASLVLFLVATPSRRGRSGWSSIGVDTDDLVGGLICLGLQPLGWSLPPDAVVTVPPRELARTPWPPPPVRGSWVFVTENPSVLAAAHQLVTAADGRDPAHRVRLLCTAGTPSDLEAGGVAGLVRAGWRVAVRADFDRAGLAHVRTLLAAAPAAVPWRMGAADYLQCPVTGATGLVVDGAESPWDPELARAMTSRGGRAYEEDLLDVLLADLLAGQPSSIQ